VGLNVAVYIAMVLAGISYISPTTPDLLHWGANFGPLTLGGQWWRLLTCTFVHIGIIHIALNMWCLWELGALAETLYGPWTYAGIYLVSGLGASLTSVAWNPIRPSAGASGAIFGLAGALISAFYLGEFSLPRAAIRGTLRSVVIFAGYNLVFGAVSGRTDNAAHIGGLAMGLILGALMVKLAADERASVPRAAILLSLLLAVVAGTGWLQHARGQLFHTQRGYTLLQDGKATLAIPELQDAIRQRPDYAPAHFALAQAFLSAGQLGNAETELKKVVALQPGNEGASYRLGSVYLNEKRTQLAKDTFTAMLARNVHSAAGHLGLGMVASAEANYPVAVEEYQTAAHLSPGAGEGLYYKLGLAYAKLQRYDDAIAALLRERQQGNDDYDTELALAAAYQAKGMRSQAEEAIRRAAQLKSENPANP
jgi:membrane associated rhomboid family serine protease/Tfp pilus assembly protein PilF